MCLSQIILLRLINSVLLNRVLILYPNRSTLMFAKCAEHKHENASTLTMTMVIRPLKGEFYSFVNG